uniref:beta-N-acetylhexosaminidase n=1 Tax=Populus trichocarpa TaxID=3694 RepID=A0A2K1R5N6_POPTR
MPEAWMLESRPGNGTLSQLLETFVSSTFPYIVSLNRTVVCWEDFLLDDNTLHFFHLIIYHPTIMEQRSIASSSEFYNLDCGRCGFVGNDSHYDPPPPSGNSGSGGSWCGPFKTWQTIYNYDITYGLTPEETKLVLGGEVALWSEQARPTVLDTRSFITGLKFQATFMVIVSLISEENSIKRVQESIIIKVYMPSWGETYPHALFPIRRTSL